MQGVRERLLDAGESLFSRFGFAKVTMEEVAREAGLSRATIYLHFRDKKQIGLACADRTHSRLLEALRSIVTRKEPAVDRLRAMLVGRVLFAFDAAQHVSVKFDEVYAAIRPSYMDRRQQYFNNEAQLFAEVLSEGIRSGEIDVEDVPLTALALVLSTNALMPFSLSSEQLRKRGEVKYRAERISDLLIHGLRRRPAIEAR